MLRILMAAAMLLQAASASPWSLPSRQLSHRWAYRRDLNPIFPSKMRGGSGGGGGGGAPIAKPTTIFSSWLDRYSCKLFEEADLNHDGGISAEEAYELVLKFYIKVNQKAPIPPPSRERVIMLVQQTDTDRTGRLKINEFQRLLRTMYARASTRVLAHKFVSVLCAPVLSISLVHMIQGQPYLLELFDALLPEETPERIKNLLTKESLWVTVFTMILVKQLGGLVLGIVDWMWWGPKKDDYYHGVNELRDKDETTK